MGMRFRKSINLGGGARINLSKSGIGASVGGKGFRVTKKANGGTRTTASIAGTGISYTSDSKKSKAAANSAINTETANTPNYLLFWIAFRVLSIPLVIGGALLALIELAFGWIAIAIGIGSWLLANYYKKKHKANKANKDNQ